MSGSRVPSTRRFGAARPPLARAYHLHGVFETSQPLLARARHQRGVFATAQPRRASRACPLRGVFGAARPSRGSRARHPHAVFGPAQPRRGSRARHLHGVFGAALPRPARAFPPIASVRTFLYPPGLASPSLFGRQPVRCDDLPAPREAAIPRRFTLARRLLSDIRIPSGPRCFLDPDWRAVAGGPALWRSRALVLHELLACALPESLAGQKIACQSPGPPPRSATIGRRQTCNSDSV